MSGKLTDIRILENPENLCWTFWFNGKQIVMECHGGGYCVGLGIDLDRSETPRTMNATYAEETKISYKWENNSQHKNPEWPIREKNKTSYSLRGGVRLRNHSFSFGDYLPL